MSIHLALLSILCAYGIKTTSECIPKMLGSELSAVGCVGRGRTDLLGHMQGWSLMQLRLKFCPYL